MTKFERHLKDCGLPVANLIDEISDPRNVADAFDYVVSHLESKEHRDKMWPRKERYCNKLVELLKSGKFRITSKDFRTIEVKDGPKHRICQEPRVFHRVGCHAIMVPFEKHSHVSLIRNTAASIKGRGMHWLHNILEEDLLADPTHMMYFYQCDIFHYYDTISQTLLKEQIRLYTTDPIALPMLDNFVELLPAGISKGLRASQSLANLHLNEIDHLMCERVSYHTVKDVEGKVTVGDGKVIIDGKEIRFHYYRYCDDMVIFAATKAELWALSDYLKSLLAKLGLHIKSNEAVRPISEGVDYLGYVTCVDDSGVERVVYSYIRKRTKQKFARRISRVKSRKRRQALIGSFFGMAAHADCRHLLKKLITPREFKKLKHKRKMKDFGTFKVPPPTLDGKKNFKGEKVTGSELDRQGIIVVDFERDMIPRREKDSYQHRLQAASAQGISPDLVEKPKTKYIIQLICNGKLRKLWTGDREIWQILEAIDKEDGFPFFAGVEIDYSGQYKKLNFVPAEKFNLRIPTDAEVDELYQKFNLTR